MKINFVVLVISITFLCPKIFGQDKNMSIQGKISFVTLTNVYVNFESTSAMKIGDTLTFTSKKTPCLVVQNKSSKSLVCTQIFNFKFKKGDVVFFDYLKKKEVKIKNKKKISSQINKSIALIKKTIKKELPIENIENIRGKLSLTSYSNPSGASNNRQRMMYLFSLDANHINNSKLSIETYLNYRQYIQPKGSTSNPNKNTFNIYNLALKYDVNPTLSITVGRKINNKASSLGAIDGLQAEKVFGKNYVGVIAGFRPDISNYGFNSNLLEYGGYIGRTINSANIFSQTTLGLLQQNNNGKIDRRYAYFQHSSTIMKKLNIFSSIEFDLYNKTGTVTQNKISLTNFYTSARYRFSRKFNLMLSYDSRKRILYYETFQTEIERLLANNEARQGIRLRINIKPIKYVYTGFSYGKRFQSSNQNKSDNINGYLSLSKIPKIGGRFSINYNKNNSNYLNSSVISFRHSRELFNNKVSASIYFRMVDYNYVNNITSIKQNYYGTNLSFRLSNSLRFNIFGELSTGGIQNNSYRINASIIKRFKTKRKKQL